jgi:hypothetical protein
MRIALISDVHGNCFALDAALADLQRHAVDQIICLGDTLQGGAQPAETVKRLHALACPIVMGNADAWLLAEENDTAEPTTEQQREVRLWTLSQLSADDLAFIRSFQPIVELRWRRGSGCSVFTAHPLPTVTSSCPTRLKRRGSGCWVHTPQLS